MKKLKISLYATKERAVDLFSMIVKELDIPFKDITRVNRFGHAQYIETDYVQITRHSFSEGSRGSKCHLAIIDDIYRQDTEHFMEMMRHIRSSLSPYTSLQQFMTAIDQPLENGWFLTSDNWEQIKLVVKIMKNKKKIIEFLA